MGPSPIIFELDFTNPSLLTTSAGTITAAKAYLTSCGATFTRASVATAQISPNTVYTGFGVDDPRIGDSGSGQGFVNEEQRTNGLTRSSELNLWSGTGTNTIDANAVVAPDGTTTADRSNSPALNDGRFLGASGVNGSTAFTRSIWLQSNDGAAGEQRILDPVYVGTTLDFATGAAWARAVHRETVLNGAATGCGLWLRRGTAGQSTATRAWGAQLEVGAFATELIPTAGATATRLGDRLGVSAGRIVRSGRVGVEFRFRAKSTTAALNGGAAVTLLGNSGAQSYANISTDAAGRVLQLSVGGTLVTLATTISWAAGDVVDMWVELGGGSLVSSGAYRVNDGAKVSLGSTGSPHGAVTDSAFDLLNFTALSQVSSWVQRIRAYAPGRRPAWAA